MNLSQFFRRNIFWFFDTLNKNDIKNHYIDIKNIIENSNPRLSEYRKEEYLQQMLDHAVTTTSFYKKYKGFHSVFDFPVINKNMIRDHFDEFTSSRYRRKDCALVSTSGSTGTPFSVLHDKNKRCRNTGDNLYFSRRSGYEIGQELIYIKIWAERLKKGVFSRLWLQNVYPLSVFRLQDHEIASLIKKMERTTAERSMLGYTSAFETICKYLDTINSPPIKTNIKSIITMSEGLNEYVKKQMFFYFGVHPVSRYSNNENGIIAQQDRGDSSNFVINSASYYVEVFDLIKDIPIGSGKQGRIVITDLHNYAMPLVRYDTGDIGVMELDDDGVPYLESVQGRVLDLIYDTRGNVVPSHVSYKLCKYGEYKQFQLVQFGVKEYLIKLNTDTKVEEEKMIAEYKEYFGNDAIITIEYVDEIPLLSSGKRREVKNIYHHS